MRRQMTIVNEHPFSRHAVATGNWGPLRLSDFVTDRQLKATAHWRDVYRHNNVGRVIAFALFRGNRCGTLNLTRPLGDEDFSKRDMQMLALIAPHFHLALGSSEMATMRGDERAHVLLALGLTTREVEVAKWLSRGRTNQEIAAILEMKPRTVEKHVENMLVKLGVENRTTAAMVVAGIVGTAPGPAPPAAATYFDKPRRGRN
jgi:DNA-binding CsgD family transcriptional regulator